MSDIDEMAKKFESTAELQEYAQAQFNVIRKLQKENNDLKKKNEELMKNAQASSTSIAPDPKDLQSICELEIAKLRNSSLQRELTLEETRKLEIYSKVLNSTKKKVDEVPLDGVSEAELIDIAKYIK